MQSSTYTQIHWNHNQNNGIGGVGTECSYGMHKQSPHRLFIIVEQTINRVFGCVYCITTILAQRPALIQKAAMFGTSVIVCFRRTHLIHQSGYPECPEISHTVKFISDN